MQLEGLEFGLSTGVSVLRKHRKKASQEKSAHLDNLSVILAERVFGSRATFKDIGERMGGRGQGKSI